MPIPTTSAMDSLLAQMHNVAKSAASTPPSLSLNPASASNTSSSFASELKNSIDKLAATGNNANGQANAFMAGTTNASLNDVMIDLQKASLAFQTAVQVRNRFVQAYQSVASMPV